METITVQGLDFNVAPIYSEGHSLTAGEASALDQLRRENLRNNFASKVKAAKEAGTVDQAALQAQFDEAAAAYAFGVRTSAGPRAPADPVGKEAFSIARDAVKAHLRKQGKNPNDYDTKQIAEVAKAALEKNHDRFYEIARQRIAEREAIAGEALNIDDLQPSAPEAEASEKPAKGKKKAA
jgi:hypothetical protein